MILPISSTSSPSCSSSIKEETKPLVSSIITANSSNNSLTMSGTTTTCSGTAASTIVSSVDSNSSNLISSSTTSSSSLTTNSTNATKYETTTIVECAGCGSHIMDRYYLSAVDQHWHVSCLKCSQCKVNLQAEPSCFSRDGLIFCKSDYYRLFTMRRCSRCGEGIYASELVMRVRDHNVYHLHCFTCAWCNVTLSQGDLFGVRDNLVYCRNHYEMLSSSNNNNNNNNNNNQTNNVNNSSPTRYGGTTLITSSPPANQNSSPLYSLGVIPPSDVLNRHHHPHHLSSPPNHPTHHFHHLHHHPHPHLLHQHHHGSPPSMSLHLNDHITGDTCSTMAATPYPSNPSGLHHASGGHIPYSPLSITNLSTNNSGSGPTTPNGPGGLSSSIQNPHHNGQSPTTPQSIRKGRPRKRKNVSNHHHSHHNSPHHPHSHQSDQEANLNPCSHESLSSPSSRNTHSPSVTNVLDGGPLSGLAASIENSCNSQLSNSALNLATHQTSASGNSSNQRTKRMRTSFKHHQLRTMKNYFGLNQNPDAKDLKHLAQKTGLSKRVLQVWFQNARAKWRRNNLKMLPDAQELSLNGQTMLNLGHNPSTPSTVIGSPSGSTRPYSSPSPALSPSTTETSSLSHQPSGLISGPQPPSSAQLSHGLTPTSLEAFVTGRTGEVPTGNLIPMNFQELY